MDRPPVTLLPDPEADCWVHPQVEVRSSSIAGLGLFTRAPVSPGTAVVRVGGIVVSDSELRRQIEEADAAGGYVDSIVVAEDLNLVIPPKSTVHFGNHSCDPNLWWQGPYTLVARRRIEAGEELTNDYAISTGVLDFQMTCTCGSPDCRGRVTGLDWRRPELRDRYGSHWVPALLARIAAEN